MSDSDKIRDLEEDIRQKIALADYGAALTACDSAVERDGSQELFWHLRAAVADCLGLHEMCATNARRSAELGRHEWSNYFLLGRALDHLARYEEAVAALKKAHALAPTRCDVALLLLRTTLSTGGIEAARTIYAEACDSVLPRTLLETGWLEMLEELRMQLVYDDLRRDQRDAAAARSLELAEVDGSRAGYAMHRALVRHADWRSFSETPLGDTPRPTVSVLLITYNHGPYVAQALESIYAQRVSFRIEIIAVDDCSTDDTQEIILDFARRHPGTIKTVFSPTNIGMLDPPQQKVTYNGFKHVAGRYFAILEGDDYWSSPDKLQKQVDYLDGHAECVATAHNTIKIYQDGSHPPHRFLYWPNLKKTFRIADAVGMTCFFHSTSILFRNIFFGKPLDAFKKKWSCDIFWTIAHLQYGELHYFDEDMSIYRAHSKGLYSVLTPAAGRLFNLRSLIRYNFWTGSRYLKEFSFSLHRLAWGLLEDHRKGKIRSLTFREHLLCRSCVTGFGRLYDLLDAFPRLDPAVLWHGEPPKPSAPRLALMQSFYSES